MGGSSQTQKSNQTASSQTTPYKPAQSGINSILSQAQGIQPFDFSGAMPGLQSSLNAFSQGQLPPDLLASIENSTRNTIGDQFAKAGRSFSGDFVNAMTKQLVNSEAPFAFQGYQMLPGLANTAANLPYAGLQGKSNLLLPIASAFNQNKSQASGTTTTTQASDPFQTAVGGLLGGAGLLLSPMTGGLSGTVGASLLGALSDRRAKRDVQKVGSLDNGLPVYRFKYLDSDQVHIGLMADDVEEYAPDAVMMGNDGLKRVDYMRATQ